MIYIQFIYDLLNISDSVDEPNAYDMLGLTPLGLDADRVREALITQKKRMYLSLPDPTYVPTMIRLKKDLQRAADILSNEQRRNEHDESISTTLARQHEKAFIDRRKAAIEARKALVSVLKVELCLNDASRAKIESKLVGVGLKEKDVKRLLKQIPKPAPQIPNLRNQIVEFFVDAVNLFVEDSSFEDNQSQLMGLGQMFLFPPGSTGKLMGQASEGPLTIQQVELVLDECGGYNVDSEVDVPDAANASESVSGYTYFESMGPAIEQPTEQATVDIGSSSVSPKLIILIAVFIIVLGGIIGGSIFAIISFTGGPQTPGGGNVNGGNTVTVPDKRVEEARSVLTALKNDWDAAKAADNSQAGKALYSEGDDAISIAEKALEINSTQEVKDAVYKINPLITQLNGFKKLEVAAVEQRTEAERKLRLCKKYHADSFASLLFQTAMKEFNAAEASLKAGRFENAESKWKEAIFYFDKAIVAAAEESAP